MQLQHIWSRIGVQLQCCGLGLQGETRIAMSFCGSIILTEKSIIDWRAEPNPKSIGVCNHNCNIKTRDDYFRNLRLARSLCRFFFLDDFLRKKNRFAFTAFQSFSIKRRHIIPSPEYRFYSSILCFDFAGRSSGFTQQS